MIAIWRRFCSVADPRKPHGYWNREENILHFLKYVGKQKNLISNEDWKNLTKKQLQDLGGNSLLNKYTISELKQKICPELKIHNKNQKKNGYWENKENIKILLNKVQVCYNVKNVEDWKKITKEQIIQVGGSSLFSKYKYSLFDLKVLACPDYNKIYVNNLKPKGYWDNKENIKNFLDDLKVKFNLQSTEDWYRVSTNQINKNGGRTLLKKYSMFEILSQIYPDEIWNKQKLSKTNKRSNQRWLFLQIQKIYPKHEIIEDYFHEELTRISGFAIQFDIFIPKLNLAFEYHGEQHYEDIPKAFGPLEMFKFRDNEKIKLCNENGIKLIIIPHSWDNSLEILSQIINKEI